MPMAADGESGERGDHLAVTGDVATPLPQPI